MDTYNWYQALIKPVWAPLAWLFGPVCTGFICDHRCYLQTCWSTGYAAEANTNRLISVII